MTNDTDRLRPDHRSAWFRHAGIRPSLSPTSGPARRASIGRRLAPITRIVVPTRYLLAVSWAAVAASLVLGIPAYATTMECDEHLAAGAVRCVVGESWIAVRDAPNGAGGRGPADGSDGGDDGDSSGTSGDASTWPPDGWQYIHYPTYGTDEDGDPCLRWISRYLAPGDPYPAHEVAPWFEFNHPSVPPDDFTWEDCTTRPEDEPPELGDVVEALAAEIRRELPAPELAVAPDGYALTGLPAYLETGTRELTFDDSLPVSVPGWELIADVSASGRYTVDWGDHVGPAGPFTINGQPYPDGEVRHAYRDKGVYDVTVVDRWDVVVGVDGLPPLDLVFDVGYPAIEVTVEEMRAIPVLP